MNNKSMMFIVGLILIAVLSMSASAWVNTYQNRIHVNCSNMTSGTPIVVNGSNGFLLNGSTDRQIVWSNCRDSLYIYYNNTANVYTIGNDTTVMAFEIETGNISSNNASGVWTNYTQVFHGGWNNSTSLKDSSSFANHADSKGASYAENRTTDCFAGSCWYFNNEGNANGAYDCYIGSTARSNLNGSDMWTTIAFVKNTGSPTYASATEVTIDGSQYWRLITRHGSFANMIVNTAAAGDHQTNMPKDTNPYIVFNNFDKSILYTYYNNTARTVTQADAWGVTSGALNSSLAIGCTANNHAWNWNGNLDEFRLYRGNMSSATMNSIISNAAYTSGYGALGSQVENYTIPFNPVITFGTIQPVNLTIYNVIVNRVNITYTTNDMNLSTFVLVHSTNNSDNVKDIVNGTVFYNPHNDTCTNTSATDVRCVLDDNDILRGVYNYNQDYMEATSLHAIKSFNNANDRLKTQFVTQFNATSQSSFVFFEFNCNGTNSAPMLVYFSNSSNQSVLVASVASNQSFEHRHSATSGHHVVGIPINQTDYSILGVKITPTLYMEIRGSTGSNFVCYGLNNLSRPHAVESSINGGVTYLETNMTADQHYHRFGNQTYFRYKGASAGTDGNMYYSTEISDLLETFLLNPTPVEISTISDIIQNKSQTVSWTASQSPQLYPISQYEVSLYKQDGSFNASVGLFAGLSISFNASYPYGNYTIRIVAIDSNSFLSDTSISNVFEIKEPYPPTDSAFSSISNMLQNNTQTISWSESISAQSYAIRYIINLFMQNTSFIRQVANTTSLNAVYNATEPVGYYYMTVQSFDNESLNSGIVSSNVFNISLPCVANYTCTKYKCLATNVSRCDIVVDSSCGYVFTGNLTTFDTNCTYIPPSAISMEGFDLTNVGAVLLLVGMLFAWIVLMIVAFMFRSSVFAGLGFLFGIVVAIMLAQVAIGLTIALIIINIVILIFSVR